MTAKLVLKDPGHPDVVIDFTTKLPLRETAQEVLEAVQRVNLPPSAETDQLMITCMRLGLAIAQDEEH